MPVSENELFIGISEDLSQLEKLVEYVMYEAFFLKESVAPHVIKMLSKILSSSV
jgi:hypothetical protein